MPERTLGYDARVQQPKAPFSIIPQCRPGGSSLLNTQKNKILGPKNLRVQRFGTAEIWTAHQSSFNPNCTCRDLVGRECISAPRRRRAGNKKSRTFSVITVKEEGKWTP